MKGASHLKMVSKSSSTLAVLFLRARSGAHPLQPAHSFAVQHSCLQQIVTTALAQCSCAAHLWACVPTCGRCSGPLGVVAEQGTPAASVATPASMDRLFGVLASFKAALLGGAALRSWKPRTTATVTKTSKLKESLLLHRMHRCTELLVASACMHGSAALASDSPTGACAPAGSDCAGAGRVPPQHARLAAAAVQ